MQYQPFRHVQESGKDELGSLSLPFVTMTDCIEDVVREAITAFQLRKYGWRGFEYHPAVLALKARVPELAWLAINASVHNAVPWLAEATAMLCRAHLNQRQELRSYFAGRLALEQLSSWLWGPGAGPCDKLSAFIELYLLALTWCRAAPPASEDTFP